MAYRYEKNPITRQSELVIDGFEKGIADSPYLGISNIRNLNIKYADGVAYMNYKRLAATAASMTRPISYTVSPAGLIYFSDGANHVYKQSAVNSSTFTAIGSNPGTGAGGILYWSNYLLCFRTSNTIDICGDGTGDAGITSSNWNTAGGASGVWPIDSASIVLNSSISAGDTTASMSSTGYTDAQGTNRKFWNGPTGAYLGALGSVNGAQVTVSLTQGSAAISWTPPATNSAAASLIIYPLQNGTINGVHPTWLSRNDGNAYFGHANFVGSIGVNSGYQLSSGSAGSFSKTNFSSFAYNGTALALPIGDNVQGLEELTNRLMVLGNYNLYPWDRVSSSWQNPLPFQEGPVKIINLLNNLYVFAGNKGNIYVSNGYSVSRFRKIPDNAAGSIPPLVDPTWSFGGVMSHRQKLWFQATAANGQTGTPVFTGIFSIDLDTGALTMENQNSTGTGGSTTDFAGLLIDNSLPALTVNTAGYTTNYDSYYSASATLSGGNYTGTMDYNTTTLYSSNEAIIESDLIPVGTFASNMTFSNMEFKMDQPMKSGDSITVYARQSLADSYTQIGTTTSTSLSDLYTPLVLQNFQWLQIKLTMSCNATATSSSFNRIREIRIR